MSDKREEKMKKLFGFVIAIVFLLGLSTAALAGFLIQLKNGRILPTSEFWEEKEMIKFYWESGVASIPKEVIRSIGVIEEVPVMTPPNPKEPVPEPKAVVGKEEKTAEPNVETEKIDPGYYKKQRAFFTEKFEQAHERYLEASSQRDREAKKKAWEEFTQYAGKVSALEEELKKKNNGVLPEWWNK